MFQSRVSVVKNSRQIVRKVPVSRQPQQQQQQQPQHQVKLREIPSLDQGGSQQQQAQQVKVVKRTVVSSGEMQSQVGGRLPCFAFRGQSIDLSYSDTLEVLNYCRSFKLALCPVFFSWSSI